MTQRFRHRDHALMALVLLFGCSTSNTESWTITNPSADQLFTMTTAEAQANEKKISVSGGCSLPDISNYLAVGDSNNNLVSGPYDIKSETSPSNWSRSNVILKKPQGASIGTEFPLKIATGRPNPLMPTEVKSHVVQNIKLKVPNPYQMPMP